MRTAAVCDMLLTWRRGNVIVFLIVLPVALLIVLMRWRMLKAENAGIGLREASAIRAFVCMTRLPADEIGRRLADGVPAGDLVCTWDAERRLYCFRSELPDGSIPVYCRLIVRQEQAGTRVKLIRQKALLSGERDVLLRMHGFLAQKLMSEEITWTTDA